MGAFAECQSAYAARRLPTFPVNINRSGDKRPAVRGWDRVGLRASAGLAERFPDANAFGFCAGRKTGVTVLDVDTTDERVLADALDRHGPTPLVVLTGGKGGFQAYYRHNGEGRHIRPHGKAVPVDVLGGGYVVAAPSWGVSRRYEVVAGSLDDLDTLPAMRAPLPANDAEPVAEGRRNDALFRYCMKAAHGCDTLDALAALAMDEASTYLPPIGGEEVVKTAASAWRYTVNGDNRVGTRGSWIPADKAATLAASPHLCALIVYLQGMNRPEAEFWIADGLQEKLGWSRRDFQKARREAIESGWVRMIRPRAPGRPAVFKWA